MLYTNNQDIELLLKRKELTFAKIGLVWGIIAGVLWGLDGVLMGINLNLVPFKDNKNFIQVAILGACIHDGFAALWILIKNIIAGKWRDYGRTLVTKPARTAVFGGILGGPIGMSGSLLGIHLAGASYSSAITAAYPVLGVIMGMIFLKERVTKGIFIGISLTVFGALIVSYTPPAAGSFPHFYLGMFFAVMAVFGWALEGVISTYGMDLVDSDIAIGIRELSSFIMYLIIIAVFFRNNYGILKLAAHSSFWFIAGTALIGGCSFLCWYRSMNMIGVSKAMGLNVTYALWSVLFCWLFTDLKLSLTLIVGAITISIGTILTIGDPHRLSKVRSE